MRNSRKKEITHFYISYTSHKYSKLSMAYVELSSNLLYKIQSLVLLILLFSYPNQILTINS